MMILKRNSFKLHFFQIQRRFKSLKIPIQIYKLINHQSYPNLDASYFRFKRLLLDFSYIQTSTWDFCYILFKKMKKSLIILLLLCIIIHASAQQIPINPTMLVAPELPDEYSIVHTFVYPQSTSFASTLPKDFYVNKLQQAKPTQTVQKPKQTTTATGISNLNLSFENIEHVIQVISSQAILNPIKEFYAIKSIYPQAIIQQPQIQLKPIQVFIQAPKQVSKPEQQNFGDESYKRVDNQNKQIQWKIKDLPKLNDVIVEKDIQRPLSKTSIVTQTGTAQIATEEPINNNQQLAKNTVESSVDKKPLLYNSPTKPITKGSEDKNQNLITENQKQTNIPTHIRPTNKQILEQIEKIRYKSHKWSIIIVIMILAVLFIVFLLMKCWGNRNGDFWQNLNQKFAQYQNATEVSVDDEEQIMTTKTNELIQNEFQQPAR